MGTVLSPGWRSRRIDQISVYSEQLECIIDLNAEVSHGRLQLGMSEKQLDGAQVLGSLIDQRCAISLLLLMFGDAGWLLTGRLADYQSPPRASIVKRQRSGCSSVAAGRTSSCQAGYVDLASHRSSMGYEAPSGGRAHHST